MTLKANVIAPLDIKPDDVTDLLLSHMHWDHAGGIGLFPKARVWVQKIDADDVLEIVRRNTEGKTWTRTRRSRRRSTRHRTCARSVGCGRWRANRGCSCRATTRRSSPASPASPIASSASSGRQAYNRVDAGPGILEGGGCGPLEPSGEFLALLETHRVPFCLIGGHAVNAYVDPLVSLDLDVVIASDRLAEVEALLTSPYRVERFAHSVIVSAPGSDLRVQIQLDTRYRSFIERAAPRDVLGVQMPVAAVEDVLQGKIWAAQDSTRRGSKRQKDLADIARLLEAYPHLRRSVPSDVLDRLL